MRYLLMVFAFVLSIVSGAIFPLSASAATITYAFEGTVSHITIDQTGQVSASGISSGTAFSGQFAFDTDAVGSGGTTSSTYGALGINVAFDTGQNAASGNSTIQINNGIPADQFRFIGNGSTSSSFAYDDEFSLQIDLEEATGTIFDGTTLPLALLLTDFTSTQFIFVGIDGALIDIFRGNLTSLTQVSPVPLPAALPLFLTMLAGMGFLRWRRNKRALA